MVDHGLCSWRARLTSPGFKTAWARAIHGDTRADEDPCQERMGNVRRAVVVLSRASWSLEAIERRPPLPWPGTFWNVCLLPRVNCVVPVRNDALDRGLTVHCLGLV